MDNYDYIYGDKFDYSPEKPVRDLKGASTKNRDSEILIKLKKKGNVIEKIKNNNQINYLTDSLNSADIGDQKIINDKNSFSIKIFLKFSVVILMLTFFMIFILLIFKNSYEINQRSDDQKNIILKLEDQLKNLAISTNISFDKTIKVSDDQKDNILKLED